MTLNLQGIPNFFFKNSRANEEGISIKKAGAKNIILPGFAFMPSDSAKVWNFTTTEGVINIPAAVPEGGSATTFMLPLNFPKGTIISSIKIYGVAGATWSIYKFKQEEAESFSAIETGNFNQRRRVALIIEENHSYFITTSAIGPDVGSAIKGILIEYE